MKNSRAFFLIWIILGAVVWVGISLYAGVSEAWDAAIYWWLGYPILAVMAGVAGFYRPQRYWLWPLFLMLGQSLAMFFGNPTADASLFPLTLILGGIMSVPLIAIASVASYIRKRMDAKTKTA